MQPLNPDYSVADPEKRNTTKHRYHRLLIQTVYDFAENTTLNGLKYISEKGTSILERLFWISTFILSTVLCIIMVHKSYTKFDTSAVAVTLKEHTASVNEYPFPAITICSQARIRQNKYNYTEKLLSLSNDCIYLLEAVALIHPSYKEMEIPTIFLNSNNTEDWSAVDYQEFHSTSVFCDEDVDKQHPFLNFPIDMDTFFQVAPKHEDIFFHCSWRNKVDCLKKFRPTLTADGVCYTFNNLASDEIFRKSSIEHKYRRYYLNTSTPPKGWSLEKNYYSSSNDTFPRRGRANGAREDLYLLLKEVKDRDFACDGQTQPGYKVYLHHPAELPQASLHSYAAQPGKTTSLAIKLDILDTAAELAGYAPRVRQCYFTSEKYLQLFQKYTSSNCQLECLTNYTIQNCGCVSFYMPRNNSTAICKGDKSQCIEDALDKYADEEDLNDGESGRCGCLPECKEVNYDADVVIAKLDLEEYKKRLEQLDNNIKNYGYDNGDSQESYETIAENTEPSNVVEKINTHETSDDGTENQAETIVDLTEIRIYYRRPRFVAMERSEMVGLSQFLADVGGTLGLFLGFSFLTLAEIFYFFSIKLCCTYRRENSKKGENLSDVDDI